MKEKAYYIVSKARQILGGTISADQCRDYVLALLFLKSASEYYKSNNSFQQDDNSPALRLLVSSAVLSIIYVKNLIHRNLAD